MGQELARHGTVLMGRYRLTEQLGEGGMGTIWRAEHLVLAAPVAVKLIDPDVIEDEDTVSRFMREAQAAANLRSPHVVQILDYGVDGRVPFMVMELLEGETLAQRIKRLGRLSPAETGRIINQVARAVGRAHEAGIVHRDLKPENVFLVHNEDEEIAKVLDFGVAKVEAAPVGPQTRTGSLLGTPYYMSPEQAQGNKAVDSRSDLWSLAVIAFECLTGKRPFYSDGLGDLVLQICIRPIVVPSEMAPVPLGFDAWFERATQREPHKRFQTARELSDSLREALGIEARETMATFPEVSVVSASGLDTEPPPSSIQPEGESVVRPVALQQAAKAAEDSDEARPSSNEARASRPDEKPAVSKQKPGGPVSRWGMDGQGAALTVRQFGTTQKNPPQKSGGGLGLVFWVGGGALVLGLAGGVAFFGRAQHKEPPLPEVVPTVPGVAAPKASEAPEAAVAEETEEDEALEDSGADAEFDADASLDAAASATVPSPEATSAFPPPEPERDPASSLDPGRYTSERDGGWQKPAWAIPDDDWPARPLEPDEEPPKDPTSNPY